MKLFVFSVFAIWLSHSLPAQDLQPTKDKTLLEFKAIDFQQNALKETVYFFATKSQKTFSVSAEVGKILLPNQEKYTIYLKNAAEQYELTTTAQPNQFYNIAIQFEVNKQKLYATPTECLVKLKIVNAQDEGVQTPISVMHSLTKELYKKHTDAKGMAEFLLPADATYSINIGNTMNYSTLNLPNKPFYNMQKEIQFEQVLGKLQPSLDSALFNLTYLDFEQKPVKGEIFTLKSQRDKKINQTLPTDEAGKTQIKVPIGDTYALSAKYLPNFATQKVEKKPDLYVLGLEIVYMPSAEWDKYQADLKEKEDKKEAEWKKKEAEMKKAMENYLQEREQIRAKVMQEIAEESKKSWEKYRADSLQEAKKIQNTNSKEYTEYRKSDELKRKNLATAFDPSTTEKKINEKIPPLEKRLKENGFTFGIDATVIQTLERNPQWKNKTIVLDVTGSMFPYNTQLEMWLESYGAKAGKPNVVFFNDGNALPTKEKEVGKTGGFYNCTACDMKVFRATFKTAIRAGDGGDSPENDIEAILQAQNLFPNAQDIILIADNSLMRDIELLNQVKKPIHVIACGSQTGVNSQYLDLAYQTGGTFHTLEQDFVDLKKLTEGNKLKIGEDTFVLIRGKFLLANK